MKFVSRSCSFALWNWAHSHFTCNMAGHQHTTTINRKQQMLPAVIKPFRGTPHVHKVV